MLPKINLASAIKDLPQIGAVYTKPKENLGMFKVLDLLYYFPFRYEDLPTRKNIAELSVGEVFTIQAKLWQITKIRTRYGKTLIKAVVNDGTNSIDVVWFNQTYLLTVLKPNQLINFSGKVGISGNKVTLVNPKYEIIKSSIITPVHTDRLVPIYSEGSGVSSKWLRNKIHQILRLPNLGIVEYLPKEILTKEKLLNLESALPQIHFPYNFDNFLEAKKRLAFEELLLLHLRNLKATAGHKSDARRAFKVNPETITKLSKTLPFELTNSQKKAVREILKDLQHPKAMNRLLQGEVGSGKTVVASFALKVCSENGYRAALMAPTEILANQHFATLQSILGKSIKIQLHTGSTKGDLEDFDVIVGTHALLHQVPKLQKLGLVVIDEQQRFGVLQRSVLKSVQPPPHFLTMTATPIPRTLALSIYGQLSISTLDEMPIGRKTVVTYLVPSLKRTSSYEFVRKEIVSGGQAYVICPLIEESESLLTVKSAKKEFERLRKEVFPDLKLGLLHGKLSSREKSQVIGAFREGKINILVTTPVVEVGIDIPSATLMLIEGSERFGLASLHQLRGRVGRGKRQSYCLLFTESRNLRVLERLKLLEKYHNGLKLAELDLELRGPGEIYGILQHGQRDFKLANTSDLELILKTRSWSEKLIEKPLPKRLSEKLQEQI